MSRRRTGPRRRDRDRQLRTVAEPDRPDRPDALSAPELCLVEVAPPDSICARLITPFNGYLRCYGLGECTVIVTREFGEWRLSIAHPRRYPDWDEISQARYRLLPADGWFAIYLPPADRYVNLHPNCFHVIECPDPEGDRGDARRSGLVGAQGSGEDAGG